MRHSTRELVAMYFRTYAFIGNCCRHHLKVAIEKALLVPVNLQRLFFAGQELHDSYLLHAVGLQDNFGL